MTIPDRVLQRTASVEQRVGAIQEALDARGMKATEAVEELSRVAEQQWGPQNGARLVARAPLPDVLARTLRARHALLPGDVGLFAYRPAGQEDTTLLLLTRHRTVVLTPHEVRSYARDSVQRHMDLIPHGGLAFRLMIYGRYSGGVADTVYRSLSFRDMMQIRPQLNREPPPEAPAAKPRVVRPTPPPPASRPRTRSKTRRG